MENIQGYGSDSENSSECEIGGFDSDQTKCINTMSITKMVVPDSHAAVPAPALGSQDEKLSLVSDENSKAQKSSSNFFGLGLEFGQGKSLWKHHSSDEVEENKERKVVTTFGEVEIPGGDFWKEFVPDNNDPNNDSPGTHHDEYYRRQTEGSLQVTKHNVPVHNQSFRTHHPLSQPSRSSKRLHLSPDDERTGIQKHAKYFQQSTASGKGQPSDGTSHYDQPSCGPNGLIMKYNGEFQEQRKLFYIHSKVAPYLNSRPVNKCAFKYCSSWPAHDGIINRVAWNVPSYSHLLLTTSMDASVQLWNVWSSVDRCVATLLSHKKAVKHAEWCAKGRKILSCSYDRSAHITDVETGKVTAQCEHSGFVTAGQAHPNNPNLFATGIDNMILMWDMRTPQAPIKHFSYKDMFGQVQDLLFIKDSQELISCSDIVSRDSSDRSIMAWDVRSGVVLSNQIFQERYTCSRLKLHPSGSQFMAQTQGGYVALFSTTTPYKMDKSKRYEGHKIDGYSIGFDISSDGSLVYSGSAENGVHCYDQRSGRLVRKLFSGKDIITDVACHPVLPSLVAGSTWGGSVTLWQ